MYSVPVVVLVAQVAQSWSQLECSSARTVALMAEY